MDAKIQKIKQLACFYPKTIVLFTKNKIIEQVCRILVGFIAK